jgi:hypothetical protein
MSCAFPRRRGFISGFVLIMLIFVSITLIALSSSFALHARRTQAATAGAQLRQILLAAPAYATAELTTRPPAANTREVQVPLPVDDATLTLTITNSATAPDTPPVAIVLAHATLRTFKASQHLEFQRTPAGWTVVAATLEHSP